MAERWQLEAEGQPFSFFKPHKWWEQINLANVGKKTEEMRTSSGISCNGNDAGQWRKRTQKEEGESFMRLLLSTSSLVHVLSITPASLFLPYFQHTYPLCQQHASQINRKYTHAYKHTGISASILAPNWREHNTALLLQSGLLPEAIFRSNQKKGFAGRPGPLSAEPDGWNRHYENSPSASSCLVGLSP